MSKDKPSAKGGRASARASHVKPVGDGEPIAPNHLEDLRSSGIDDATIEASGVYSVSTSKAVAEILGWGWRNGGALVFPFKDYDSRKVVLRRIKPDKPRMRKRSGKAPKPIKYEQPPDTGSVPYFGPGTINEQRLDRERANIYWTEGEKKTLCLDRLGLAAIGLTGCHNWNDSEAYRNGDGLTWSRELRKYAERFVRGRKHIIVYDSDAFENEHVMLAMQRLAGLLLHDGAVSVRFVRIPADPSIGKGVGIDDFFVKHGEDKTRRLFKEAEPVELGAEVAPIPPKDPLLKLSTVKWLKAAKVHRDLRLPPRYEIRRDRSLWLEPAADSDGDWKEAMRSVMIPCALLQGMEDETEQRIEIAYYAREKWHRAIVDRKALRDTRRALQDLPADVAIDSNNASLVVAWLSEFMRHNERRLPLRKFVSQCGWHETDAGTCFLLDEPITRATGKITIEADEAGERAVILRALRPQGMLDAHKNALRAAFNEDRVAAMVILGSLCAPLLKPLRAPNFGIHLSGDSSRGKTSKLVCGASVYGDTRNDQWFGSWNTTATAMELRAQTLCDLPLCFDEIGAGDRFDIEKAIYMLINGSGRGRAGRSLKLRVTPSWRTVVMSTGEHDLASDKANTGAQVRVIQSRVSGFGKLDAKGVDEVREACARNSGQVGRLWLDTLVAVEDWTPFIDLFAEAKSQFRAKSKGNTLAQRQAVFFALMALAEHIASKALGFGLEGGQTARAFFLDEGARRVVSSAGERAIDSVQGWIASEPKTFPALSFNTSGALESDVKGHVRQINGVRYREHVYFIPDLLRGFLQGCGLDYNEVVSAWSDAGYLDCDKGRKTKRMRWDGRRLHTIAVKYEALGLERGAEQATFAGWKQSQSDEDKDFNDD